MPSTHALIAVPLPFSIPVTLVVKVIAGAVEGFATVPANQLAGTTLAVVTVPPLVVGVYFNPVVCVESATSIYPSVPTGRRASFVPSCTDRSPFVV